MCQSKSSCTHLEQLKGEPKDCSAEQIAICHPGEEGHACETEESAKKQECLLTTLKERGVEGSFTSTPFIGNIIEIENQTLLMINEPLIERFIVSERIKKYEKEGNHSRRTSSA